MPSPQSDQLFAEAVRRHQAGQTAEAEGLYRQVLVLAPNHPDAMQLLGVLLAQSGRLEEGEKLIRRAIELNPTAQYYSNLGFVLSGAGRQQDAIDSYRRAIALAPDVPELHNNLGSALLATRRWDEAMESLQRALSLRPQFPEAHFNMGNVLREQRRLDEAIGAYNKAVSLRPGYAEAWHNLANALREVRRLEQAMECDQRAIALGFERFEPYNNLGTSLKAVGDLDGAIASFRRALTLKPDAAVESNLLCTLHFHPDSTPLSLRDEHAHWNQTYARPLASSIKPHLNDRSPERRLRIGYVSADLRQNPVGRFLLPLLAHHDRRNHEIFCYSDVRFPDPLTEQLRSQTDVWRETHALSHEELAELIRSDEIDVLVDLTMHLADSRLLMFARKPAPMQVTYLAYCSTTGIDAMDYRLSDPYLDPPGTDDSVYVEKTVRLPKTYWCYAVPSDAPEVAPSPAASAGHITFGCLNSYCKVTQPTWQAWYDLLRQVPQSKLVVFHPGRGKHRDAARQRLAAAGIHPNRLEFADFRPPLEYFQLYHALDIMLDPFPYAGGTTTCDAMWMGVPVVSLAGQTAVSRGGLSLLSNVGLAELVAHDVGQYVQIAADLASDRARLTQLRSSLRQRMLNSPMLDAPRFARDVEAAYRWMWRRWCGAAT